MAATTTLKAVLLGQDRSMSKTIKGAGKEADTTKKRFGHLRTEMRNMGKGSGSLKGLMGGAFKDIGGAASSLGMAGGPLGMVAGGVLAIGAAAASILVPFGKESISTFKSVAGEVNSMKRAMGSTPEEASRMRVAFKDVGIDSAVGTKGIQMFSKKLDAAKGSVKSHAKMVKNLGFDYLDANGHILPMTELLPKVADKFAAMPDGPEKTALAMKLFGKAGADLIPVLNKGAKGMDEAAKKSDELGLTLSGDNLQAMKDSKKASRDWDLAVEGLKTRFGADLLPMLNKVVIWITNKVIPALVTAGKWWTEHQDTIMKVAKGIGIAIEALWKGQVVIWKAMKTTIQTVGGVFTWLWNSAVQPAVTKILGVMGSLMRVWAGVLRGLSHVPGFGWAKDAADKMDHAADKADRLKNNIRKIPTSKTVTVTINTVGGRIRLPGGATYNAGQRAGGGPVIAGSHYLVGENGPELLSMGASGHVTPARQTAAMMSGLGGGRIRSTAEENQRPIIVQLMADGRVIQEILVKHKKRTGTKLGLD